MKSELVPLFNGETVKVTVLVKNLGTALLSENIEVAVCGPKAGELVMLTTPSAPRGVSVMVTGVTSTPSKNSLMLLGTTAVSASVMVTRIGKLSRTMVWPPLPGDIDAVG